MRDDLEQAYQAYAVELQRFAVAHGFTREEAEDVCSEVFVNAARSAYIDQGTMRAWLFRILHSRMVDTHRRWRRRPTAPLNETIGIASEDDAILTRVFVGTLIGILTPRQRQIIELHYLQDVPLGEAAGRLGLAFISAKLLNRRALARMRRCQP